MEFTIQRNEATRPNNIPSGSTVKLILNPGKSSKSVTVGRPPARIVGVRDATIRNSDNAVRSVIVSRKFGILLVSRIPIEPNKGIRIAHKINCSGIIRDFRSNT